jgi:uncharacterized phage protein (predicted DNA packaging)
MTVTLDTAKQHLNLTTTDDDDLVTRLIAAARDWLDRQLGYAVATKYPQAGSPLTDATPPALDQAVLLMVGHWYANREATLTGVNAADLPLGVCDIVNDYREWSWGEADA